MSLNDIKKQVVLVDSKDAYLGTMEKMEAHKKGVMHRAVSILIFNTKGEWLLHQRALNKYHTGGIWTNACCTHPFLGENYEAAVERRVMEEMGMRINVKNLVHLFDFTYKAELDNGLMENEFDRVFAYITDAEPTPNQDEVMAWKYLPHETLAREINSHPENYTTWFRIIFEKARPHLDKIRALPIEKD